MSAEHVDFTPRLPRHAVVDSAALEVQVVAHGEPGPTTVQLVDFSRQGMRFATTGHSWNEGESVEVRFHLNGAAPQRWTFHGRIRWLQEEDQPAHTYGCDFDETVTWEQLGELLLSGVLAQR